MRRTAIFTALLLLVAVAVAHRKPVSGQPGPDATVTPVRTPTPVRSPPVCRLENGSPVIGQFTITGEVRCPATLFTASHMARPQELYTGSPLPGRLTLPPYGAAGFLGPERPPSDSPRPPPRQSVTMLSYSDQPVEIDADQPEATLVAPAGYVLQASSSGGVVEPCWHVDRRSNVVRCRTSAGRIPVFIQFTTVPLQPPPTDQIVLPAGCSRVQLTWPERTPLFAVVLAVEPSAPPWCRSGATSPERVASSPMLPMRSLVPLASTARRTISRMWGDQARTCSSACASRRG